MVPLRISRSHQNHGSLVGVKAPCGRVVSSAPWLTTGILAAPAGAAPLAKVRAISGIASAQSRLTWRRKNVGVQGSGDLFLHVIDRRFDDPSAAADRNQEE